VNYYIESFSKSKLKLLLKKMRMKPEELLRKNEVAYKAIELHHKNYTDDESIK